MNAETKQLSNVCPICHLNGGYHSIHCPNNKNWGKKAVKPEQFEKFIADNFTQEDGQPKATTVEGIPYYTYRWGAELDGRDWESVLWDRLKSEFEQMKAKGAVRLIWRKRPEIETYDDFEIGKKYITIRSRVAALDKDGKQVIGEYAPEGSLTSLLHGAWSDDSKVPTVTDEVPEPKPDAPLPDGPIGGYNVVAATAASIVFCAQMCHEVNRAYCEMNHDLSQQPWPNAPEWARGSAIKGVEFLLQNPKATAADSHESWMKQKLADGWKYGPVKDVDKKTHPAMLPYDELPHWQRIKDALFQAVVRSFFGG